jgi:hypothetical protein
MKKPNGYWDEEKILDICNNLNNYLMTIGHMKDAKK